MQIMTLNTWGTCGPAARWSVLCEALRTLNPDILCLQEVVDDRLSASLSDLYATRLHARGGGLAILSRLPILRHKELTYSAVSPLESERRQALLVEIQCALSPLWVVTTHLAWRAEDEATRLLQVEELLLTIAPLGNRLLLTGDFNASPEQPPIQRIRQRGFCDLYEILHPHEAGITWDNKNPFIQSHSSQFPDRRIDDLFLHREALQQLVPLSCEVVCSTATTEGLTPSDHYGLLARFKS